MIDLKAFRKANKLGQSELANYLGVSSVFISHIECGRSNLPDYVVEKLTNNDRGWVIPEGIAEAQRGNIAKAEGEGDLLAVIVARLDEANARFAEQNAQIDRLLTIVEQLTKGGAK